MGWKSECNFGILSVFFFFFIDLESICLILNFEILILERFRNFEISRVFKIGNMKFQDFKKLN